MTTSALSLGIERRGTHDGAKNIRNRPNGTAMYFRGVLMKYGATNGLFYPRRLSFPPSRRPATDNRDAVTKKDICLRGRAGIMYFYRAHPSIVVKLSPITRVCILPSRVLHI
jgi:hypothetical protein